MVNNMLTYEISFAALGVKIMRTVRNTYNSLSRGF